MASLSYHVDKFQRRSMDWIAASIVVLLVEWQVSRSRYSIHPDYIKAQEGDGMLEVRQELLKISDPAERQQLLDFLVWKEVLIESAPNAGEAIEVPAWQDRERCERKIKAGRGALQDKVLLALGVLCAGNPEVGVSSGSVKRYLRDLGQSSLADDATTFLSKLSDSGDLKLLPDRLSRRETVFELTDTGVVAIRELLI